ncbi:TPA: hypothetical protein I8W54_002000 [Morganella morganii]|uniref:hypothetical protein n=1 Tax=Morganella morganii TaxID=582 RepID=UPI001A2FFFFC|nr:hypothetical protein [Morganella morganii]HAT1513686.1 hypothetical protein [Morganella morganii]
MSKRDDIIDGKNYGRKYGLIYTEVLGWIDLGHAQGNDIRELLRKIDAAESTTSEKSTYDIHYSQSMVDPTRTMKMGKFVTWRIKRGRSYEERKSIALGMMMSVASKFEALQSSFFVSMVTDSGFSGEDLVSDLLGFYRVVTNLDLFPMLKPVSKESAIRRWNYYGEIGKWKNETFVPLLFPDPAERVNPQPVKGTFPNVMQTVKPWSDFTSGIVSIATREGSYMDRFKGGSLPFA